MTVLEHGPYRSSATSASSEKLNEKMVLALADIVKRAAKMTAMDLLRGGMMCATMISMHGIFPPPLGDRIYHLVHASCIKRRHAFLFNKARAKSLPIYFPVYHSQKMACSAYQEALAAILFLYHTTV